MDKQTRSKRIKEGMLKAASKGKHIGRPPKWAHRRPDGSLYVPAEYKELIDFCIKVSFCCKCGQSIQQYLKYKAPKIDNEVTLADFRRMKRSCFYYGYVSCDGKLFKSDVSLTYLMDLKKEKARLNEPDPNLVAAVKKMQEGKIREKAEAKRYSLNRNYHKKWVNVIS